MMSYKSLRPSYDMPVFFFKWDSLHNVTSVQPTLHAHWQSWEVEIWASSITVGNQMKRPILTVLPNGKLVMRSRLSISLPRLPNPVMKLLMRQMEAKPSWLCHPPYLNPFQFIIHCVTTPFSGAAANLENSDFDSRASDTAFIRSFNYLEISI